MFPKAVKALKQTLEIAPGIRSPLRPGTGLFTDVASCQSPKSLCPRHCDQPELHTPENDLAFREKRLPLLFPPPNRTPLKRSRRNISSLEELLNSREAEGLCCARRWKQKGRQFPKSKTVLITGQPPNRKGPKYSPKMATVIITGVPSAWKN